MVKELHPDMNITVENGEIRVTRPRTKTSFYGLADSDRQYDRGCRKGFERNLEIVGVGYRAQKQGNKLVLSIGYSHPVETGSRYGNDVRLQTGVR